MPHSRTVSALLLVTAAFTPIACGQIVPTVGAVAHERAGVLLTVEVHNGAALLDQWLESELFASLRALPEWKEGMKSRDAKKALGGARLAARLLGREPMQAARDLLGQDLRAALRPSGNPDEPDWILLSRAADDRLATELMEVIGDLVGLADEEDAGTPAIDHRGAWFGLSNDSAWLAAALDDPSLTSSPPGLGRVEIEADLAMLRAAGALDLPTTYDNALPALFLHGAMRALDDARTIRGSLSADGGATRVELRVDGLSDPPREEAPWFFPSQAGSALTDLSSSTDSIATLHLHRDFGAFFAERFDLLQPQLESKILEFDTIMSLFFGGHSFGDEVLPALGTEALLVVAKQTYEQLPRPPEIQLPGMSLVVPIADRDGLSPSDLAVAFQTTIGLINVDRAQNGLSPLLIATDTDDDRTTYSARYRFDDEGQAPGLRFNAAPALTVCEAHDESFLVVGSSQEQVEAAAVAISSSTRPAPPSQAHTALEIDVSQLTEILGANRKPLVAQRMLEEGESRMEAERFWDRLLSLLAHLERIEAEMNADDEGMSVSLHLAASATKRAPRVIQR